MLKNRYFLNRLKQFRKNPGNYKTQQSRLREMAVVLARNESNYAPVWNIDALRALSSEQLLGIDPANVSGEIIDASRRRFASALHPDRVRGLPSWTEKLFAELMKLVNEASDSKKKK